VRENPAPIQAAAEASAAVVEATTTTVDAALEAPSLPSSDIARDAPVVEASALAVASVGGAAAEPLTVASVDPSLLAASQTAAKNEPNAATGQKLSPLMLAWWIDNLLVLITAILTILVLITAWMMRSVGGRSDVSGVDPDALMDEGASAEPSKAMIEKFVRDLEGMDLELADASDESGHWSRR